VATTTAEDTLLPSSVRCDRTEVAIQPVEHFAHRGLARDDVPAVQHDVPLVRRRRAEEAEKEPLRLATARFP